MQLTDHQQAILEGSRGPFLAKCMKWLSDWGEVMGAKRLIKVHNTHALLPVPNLMAKGASKDVLTKYMQPLYEATEYTTAPGCHCTVHATFVSRDEIDAKENDPEQVKLQRDLANKARDAGFIPTFTCAPYLVGNVPVMGEICAWTESSAVVYANSIFGARTTRHGTESAIAASLLGWVPEFGVLLDENRQGTLRIKVTAELSDSTDWGALGYFAGKEAGLGIPVFEGTQQPSQEDAKQLCAALATSGAVTMCHIVGTTPEAPTLEVAFHGNVPESFLVFDEKKKRETYYSLRNHTADEVDMVVLGCPHASLREIGQFAALLKGKKIAKGVRLWIDTAHGTKENADYIGYSKIFEEAGGSGYITDGCPMNLRMSSQTDCDPWLQTSPLCARYV